MRLIDADALKAKLMIGTNTATYSDYCNGYCDARQVDLDAIDAAPTIDPEVRHGRWKTKVIHDAYCFQCSACNSIYNGDTHYCPHCGARMDGDHIADDSKKVGGADNG